MLGNCLPYAYSTLASREIGQTVVVVVVTLVKIVVALVAANQTAGKGISGWSEREWLRLSDLFAGAVGGVILGHWVVTCDSDAFLHRLFKNLDTLDSTRVGIVSAAVDFQVYWGRSEKKSSK